jgi:WD40 repeat protein
LQQVYYAKIVVNIHPKMKNFVLFFALFRLIPFYSQNMQLAIPLGHTDKVTHANFVVNDKRILTVSKDQTMKLWDVASGKLLRTLNAEIGAMKSPQISSDGLRLLAVYKGVLKLWDLNNGKVVKEIQENMLTNNYGFNPNGKLFYFGSNSETYLYSASTGMREMALENKQSWEKSGINFADFTQDGKYFAFSSSNNKCIYIHEMATGREVLKLDGYVSKFKYSPDGKNIVSFDLQKNIRIWDVENGELKFTLPVQNDFLRDIIFNPISKRFITIQGSLEKITIWDIDSGLKLGDITGNVGLINAEFTSDGKELIVTGFDGSVCYDAISGTIKKEFSTKKTTINLVNNFSGHLISAREEVFLKPNDNDAKHVFLEQSNDFSFLNSSMDGKKILGTSRDESVVTIWDARSGKLLSELKGFTNLISDAYLSPSGGQLITASKDKTNFWTLNHNLLTPNKNPILDSVELVRFSPDGKTMVLLFSTKEKKVGLFRTEDFSCVIPNLQHNGIQNITMNNIGSFKFTEDNKKIFISNNDWGSYLFDAHDGSIIKSIKHDRTWFSTINNSGSHFLSFAENVVSVIDLEDDQLQKIALPENVQAVEFVGNQHQFMVSSYLKLYVFDVNIKKPKLEIQDGKKIISKNGRYLYIAMEYEKIACYDLITYKKIFEISTDPEQYEFITGLVLSADNNFLYYSTSQGDYYVINSLTGQQLQNMKGSASEILISNDGKYIIGIHEETLDVFDATNFKLLVQVKDENNQINYAEIFQNQIFTISNGNIVKLWELKTGELICSQPVLDKNYSFVSLPSGYFKANSDASKRLYYLDDQLNIISMDQLEVKFNRPDLVLKAIGDEDTLMINSYYRAYEKRLKKMGIDTMAFKDGFSFPEAEFVNKDKIDFDQTTAELKLQISGFDNSNKLDRFNIWINEIPLYGKRGYSLKNRHTNILDTIVTIQLSEGENRIETSVTNSNAIESFRSPLYVNYVAETPYVAKTYFIGIGIDKFKEPNHDLSYSVKDVQDLAKMLKSKLGDKLIIDTLFNESVTVSNIQRLKDRLFESNINDKVIISYSGHGLLSKEFDYYLSSYTVDFKNPEFGGIPYEVLEGLLDSIPARKKLLMIDACHSGEVDKEELLAFNATEKTTGKKGAIQVFDYEPKLGLKNSFQLMQELFVNVQKGSGATVISAAAGNQYALEGGQLSNGFFTFAILDYMKSSEIVSINSMKKFVYSEVERLSDGLQQPTSRLENMELDWRIW